MAKNRNYYSAFSFFLLPTVCCLLSTLFISGCVSIKGEKSYGFIEFPEPEKKGIYHKVKKGETLWRIARAYDVSMSDLINTNNIPNGARIEENQLIFIPGRDVVREVMGSKGNGQDDFVWPLRGKIIRYFHERKGDSLNQGLDIASQEGSKVRAARSGQVIFADYLAGHGYMIILDHKDNFYTIYAQNAKLLVGLDDSVSQNQEIAEVAGTKDFGYAHFEIRKNSIEDNPLYYLP